MGQLFSSRQAVVRDKRSRDNESRLFLPHLSIHLTKWAHVIKMIEVVFKTVKCFSVHLMYCAYVLQIIASSLTNLIRANQLDFLCVFMSVFLYALNRISNASVRIFGKFSRFIWHEITKTLSVEFSSVGETQNCTKTNKVMLKSIQYLVSFIDKHDPCPVSTNQIWC